MKLSRQWLRAMKVWGQDGNYNAPVSRREGNRFLRQDRKAALSMKRTRHLARARKTKIYYCDRPNNGFVFDEKD
jgi:hypothetical protein